MFLLYRVLLCFAYKELDYNEITNRFAALSKTCPYLKVTTAQEKYDLPYPSNCNDCEHLIATISNANISHAPQVYFSGCLHGDERLGPVVVTELASFLCSEYEFNPWIRRLVDTRLIILTPTTNAQGYYRRTREEYINKKLVDPNRDFPYDNPEKCFESITSRVIASIYEEYLIRIGITFHGGTNSITYPWGTYNHMKGSHSTEAPDFYRLDRIAKSVRKYSEAKIGYGSMTDIVYQVNGGLEDWAYAGGWENKGLYNCSSFSINNTEGLKQMLFLVETDFNKNPPDSNLGKKSEVLKGGGLIPQFIRMSLAITDLAEPYIIYNIFKTTEGIAINWELWGCIDVNRTFIYYSTDISSDWETWNHTSLMSGGCRWKNFTLFSQNFEIPQFYFVIYAEVDKFNPQEKPDPNVMPQTHIVKSRTIKNYHAYNDQYDIFGNNYTATDVINSSSVLKGTIRSLHSQGEITINSYIDHFEFISNLSASQLYISKYGDYRYEDNFTSLLPSLCKSNEVRENGYYYNCSNPTTLIGKFINTENSTTNASLVQGPPQTITEKGGICSFLSTILLFKKLKDSSILMDVESDSDWVMIEYLDQVYNFEDLYLKDNKIIRIPKNKIIGAVLTVKSNEGNGTCIVGIAKSIKIKESYAEIKLTKFFTFILFLITFGATVFIFIRSRKRNTLIRSSEQAEDL